MKKRAAIYTRIPTADQHPETQVYDLREMAKQRGSEILANLRAQLPDSRQQ